jgi:hypothetical protein
MSSPPSIVYVVPTDAYYVRRDWNSVDISFIVILGVLTVLILSCAIGDCMRAKQPSEERREQRRAYARDLV